jgi:hypothetical protein
VLNGLLDLELTIHSDKVWFTLSRYVNSQNNSYQSTENPHAVYEVPVHGVKVVVWSTISARRIMGQFFYATYSRCYVRLIVTPFFDQLTQDKKYIWVFHAGQCYNPHSQLV